MERVFSLLYKAAREGNVTTLRQLLEQDSLILDRLIINNNGFSETPLHVAAMLGHADFVQEIITHKLELAKELDIWRSTPLHLAVAKGHLETVRVLLSTVDHELMSSIWDGEGRNPLHLAAMRGRLDVLRELLKVAPEAIWVNLKDRSETILHVCVRHNQLEALKFLVNNMDDYQIVNAKDDYGMTLLHLAVTNKQIETVKFLLINTKIEVNAVNASKFTALDILAQSQRSEKDFDILESLHSMGASRATDQPLPMDHQKPIKATTHHHHVHQKDKATTKPRNWLTRKRESLMVVASLIATMAFQAGTTPPGGLWQDSGFSSSKLSSPVSDENINNVMSIAHPPAYHFAGESIISYYNHHYYYHIYLLSNTVGFVGSLSIILLLVTGLPFCRKFLMWILTVVLWVTITAMTITYIIAIYVAAPGSDFWTTFYVTPILVITWGGVMLVIALLHTSRVFINLFQCFRNFIRRRRRQYNCTDVESSM
ncbi:ankyrin repeat-containing protein NPR4-like [Humulus lupulus]|uniref:ankyrin repeat-containing protein NPR4-like n=1 Tax=Humulus lupulus TaxID=3486 RepID=UPI002B40F023|nr:ankyrin repeat-containing protein NPR4-like [Humulus lupulus]